MTLILILIALVAGVTLYDYFSQGAWAQVTSDQRNDVVFEQRNQEYGAYVLRKDYSKLILIIMGSFILILGLTFGTVAYYQSKPEDEQVVAKKDNSQFVEVAPPMEEEVPPPPKELVPPPPPLEERVAFVPPVVTNLPTEDPVFLQDPDAAKVGKENQQGNGDPFVVTPDPTPDPVPDPPKPDEPAMFVDEEAVFPGGTAAMNAYIQNNLVYPQVAIENNIQGKCYLKFVVSVDGSISQVTVVRGVTGCPECDKAALKVVKSMPAWKPGKLNGRSTSSWFQLPINFTLE